MMDRRANEPMDRHIEIEKKLKFKKIEIWPISRLNDSETQERGLQKVKIPPKFPFPFGASSGSTCKLGNRSVFIDPSLHVYSLSESVM